MYYTHQELRKAFSDFWKERDHKEVPPSPLIPNDSTTLFTGSGMQQFVPNLLGEPHPLGKRLFDIQPSIRVEDIEEVGDFSHDTFFEMMGNWSLGDYFKDKQLPWCWEFFTDVLKLPKEKLHVTIFEGTNGVPKDIESYDIWKSLGVAEDHVHPYGVGKNWWSRSGPPEKMPIGEIGGPDSEVFYDFGEELKLHENSKYKSQKCHVNCSCGRYLEIGNSVFIQYQKQQDGTLKELNQRNVDFGGGLERILTACSGQPDMYKTDVFNEIIKEVEKATAKQYSDPMNQLPMRVVADHIKTATFLIVDGVRPSNKEQGYVLRRLLRRSAVKMYDLGAGLTPNFDSIIDHGVLHTYDGVQGIDRQKQRNEVFKVINDEMDRFGKSLDNGLKEIKKIDQSKITGKFAFDLYQNYGFPLEITEELLQQNGHSVNREEFYKEYEKHRELSRGASAGKFKGGLADHSDQVIKYHTATHLIHQALFDVLGDDIRQEGSNITGERLRFDFSTSKKPTKEDINKVQETAQKKIDEKLPMTFTIMPRDEAFKVGARSFFKEKYPEEVKVYYIGETLETAYSKEFCGGPHVKNTSEIGHIEIYKFEKIGSNLYRIYAK